MKIWIWIALAVLIGAWLESRYNFFGKLLAKVKIAGVGIQEGVTGRPYLPGIDPYSGLPITPVVTGRPYIYGIDPYTGLPMS